MSTEKQPDTKPKIDLGLLEEDDEFEEFPAEGEKLSALDVYYRLDHHFYHLCGRI